MIYTHVSVIHCRFALYPSRSLTHSLVLVPRYCKHVCVSSFFIHTHTHTLRVSVSLCVYILKIYDSFL